MNQIIAAKRSVLELDLLNNYSARDTLWDRHKAYADGLAKFYQGTRHQKYAERISQCASCLSFKLKPNDLGDVTLKLNSVYLCHVRQCMICAWCKQRVWRMRFLEAMPKMVSDHPGLRFIFLTLTVKNCPVEDLRDTVKLMSKAFHKMVKRTALQKVVLGYARSLEVTRSESDEAHPHIHVIFAVRPSYFSHNYIKFEEWRKMWQQSLHVDYEPIVRVQVIKSSEKRTNDKDGIISSVCEVAKYSVKPSDLLGLDSGKKDNDRDNKAWLLELTDQMHGLKQMNLSGLFRDYLKEEEPVEEEILNAIEEDEGEEDTDSESKLFFSWYKQIKRYARHMAEAL